MYQDKESWVERVAQEDYQAHPFHTSRYEFTASFVSGKSILDTACGVGYGSRLLTDRGARMVIGMDLERSAIEQGVLNIDSDRQNLHFVTGNATSIPLPDRSINIIVSLETLEHIADDQNCLREFHRVLSDDGLLILSTPNALVTKPINNIPRNPFHVREYEPAQLEDLLRRSFGSVELLGQQVRGTTSSHNTVSRSSLHRFVTLFPLSWRQALPKFMPRGLADSLVTLVTGHNFILRSNDLEFKAKNINESPVLVALCRKHGSI